MKVTFRIEDEVVYEYTCAYGESMPGDKIPEIPEKDGYYGVWPEFDFAHITANRVLDAEYVQWVSGLKSTQTADGGQPLILVEGRFLPEWKLDCTMGGENADEGDADAGNLLSIVDETTGQQAYAGPVQVRYYLGDTKEKQQVWVKEKDVFVETESETMGSYLVFEMNAPGTFRITEAEADKNAIFLGIAVDGAALALILVLLVTRHFKKKKKGGKERVETE